MTTEKYYSILERKHAATDWNSLQSIKEYNRFARELRHSMQDSRPDEFEPSGISQHPKTEKTP